MFKVRAALGESDERGRWVSEEEVNISRLSTCFASVGLEALRNATERKLRKRRRDSAQREVAKRAMEEFAPLWDALTPAERASTMERAGGHL